jgi:hypothetical protein
MAFPSPEFGSTFRSANCTSTLLGISSGARAARNGELGSTVQRILEEMKPEAAYFAEEEGKRTGYIFFHMTNSSELPAVAEPWLHAFSATLTVRPAMNAEDLGVAESAIQKAVAGYAKTAKV